MRSLKQLAVLQCLKCNAIYDAPLIKLLRLNLYWRSYERCACCGRWAYHKQIGWAKGSLSQKEESEKKG